jgi:hypothetical protein
VARAHDRGGLAKDLNIKVNGPTSDVLGVQVYALGIAQAIAPAHLPKTGDSRTYAAIVVERRTVEPDLPGQAGARTHQAHVTNENIPKLRQFIEARASDEGSDGSYAGVVRELLEHVPLRAAGRIAVQEIIEQPVSINHHRTELVEPESAAIAANAILRINHPTARGTQHGKGNYQKHREQDRQEQERTADIDCAFGYLMMRCERTMANKDSLLLLLKLCVNHTGSPKQVIAYSGAMHTCALLPRQLRTRNCEDAVPASMIFRVTGGYREITNVAFTTGHYASATYRVPISTPFSSVLNLVTSSCSSVVVSPALRGGTRDRNNPGMEQFAYHK